MARALTPEQKAEVVQRLLTAWLKVPEQRLGQLICNAEHYSNPGNTFLIEDFALVESVEGWVRSVVGRR